MKVYCKRTLFRRNNNFHPINGKEYGEHYVEWEKGKFYNFREPKEYEKGGNTIFSGIYYYIECEREFIFSPINEKEFRKHFLDIDEIRASKIEKILK